MTYAAQHDGSIVPASGERADHEYKKMVKSLAVNLHYLADDRKLGEQEARTSNSEAMYTEMALLQRSMSAGTMKPRTPLDDASQTALEWARKQLIKASRIGEASTNSIYNTLIGKLAKSRHVPAAKSADAVRLLSQKIVELTKLNNEFAEMELTSEIHHQNIINALRAGRAQNAAVYQVAELYADGTQARLKALQEFKGLLDNFLRNMNSFFSDKSMSFNLKEGFVVRGGVGKPLALNQLSSGEKQLLLLLFDTLASSDDANVFIIDEPEISLNVKWQRNLLDALLSCIPNKGSQIILATHSIQILSNFKNYTVELRPKRSHAK
jgi:predicted ATP-dependent endonuclease of OLD family